MKSNDLPRQAQVHVLKCLQTVCGHLGAVGGIHFKTGRGRGAQKWLFLTVCRDRLGTDENSEQKCNFRRQGVTGRTSPGKTSMATMQSTSLASQKTTALAIIRALGQRTPQAHRRSRTSSLKMSCCRYVRRRRGNDTTLSGNYLDGEKDEFTKTRWTHTPNEI